MKTTFSGEEVKRILEEYYKRLEGRNVKVKISVKKELVGFYELEECVTTFAIVEKMDVAGIHKEVETILSTDELKTNLGALLNLYEFDLVSFSIDSGLSSTCEGYGIGERIVKEPYFNGITVQIEKNKGNRKAKSYI